MFYKIIQTAVRDRIKQHGFVRRIYLGIALLALLTGAAGRLAVATEQDPGARELWQDETPTLNLTAPGQDSPRILRLDTLALRRLLADAPDEAYREADDRRAELPLPMPDGSFLRFQIEESAVMEGPLAARYPEIQTYSGYSIDDRLVTMRCDLTPQGFHATVILADHSVVSIHPQVQTPQVDGGVSDPIARYVSYPGKISGEGDVPFTCGVEAADPDPLMQSESLVAAPFQTGGSRRTYRIAIAASWEYANTYGGGTNAGTVASMVTWLNAVNTIYERELTVRLQMIDAPTILYTTERGFSASTDPFTNGDNGAMLGQLGPVMASIPIANFDIGHVLGLPPPTQVGSSGVAYVGVACWNTTQSGGPIKGLGVTVVSGSVGNSTGTLVLSHELGHQFGARHSFNGTSGNCGGGNRSGSSAFEPGSGVTLMSYAGGCSTDNIGSATLRFHVGNMRQINNHIGGLGNCFTSVSTGNNAPTVNGGPDYTIPMRTPFELRASGNDPDAADASNLTYVWEQTDAGNSFSNPPYTDSGDPTTTTRPILRPYAPISSPSRLFPSLTYILNNANVPPDTVSGLRVAESLPMVGRTLNFGVALRDNRAGGGGIADDSVQLTVAGNAGPFQVTSPNTAGSVAAGTALTVQWNVNNTNLAPVNCSQVRISLSTDNGQTFPTILSAMTPNDGTETVTLPAGSTTTQARVKVEAVGNIFFDISDAAFTITSSPVTAVTVAVSPSSVMEDGGSNLVYTLTRNNVNLASAVAVSFSLGGTASASTGAGVAADYTVSGGGVSFSTASGTGTVSFAANVTSAQVIVSPVADQTAESANETVILSLAAGSGYGVGIPSSATGTIVSEEVIPANSTSIAIPDSGSASPYPSTITVSGVTGLATRMRVTLNGLSHTYPDDIDILLVGPTGARTILMSDVGGDTGLSNVTLTFDSAASASLSDQGAITSGTYLPTNDSATDPDPFSSPAPAGPYTAGFSPFLGTNPNGVWSLYVMDDAVGDSGAITSGWSLEILASTPVGVGIYDDRHARWMYSGNWVESGLGGPYNGTIKYTSDLSATAMIQITGTAFRLKFTRHTSAGILGVYVDGTKVADVNANGALNWQSVYERTGLSSGVHSIEIRHGGGGTFIDIDAIEVSPSMVGTGIYDDRHASWLYGGNWVEAGLAGPYNGTVKHTSDLNAVALIRIEGTAFRLRFTRHSSAGILGIYVDGTKVADVNANGPVNWQSVYERTGLSSGAHTIEVRHGGGGTFIDIDAIEVYPPPVGIGIYDDRHANWLYGGNWVEAGLAGPYNGTVKYTSDLKAVALIRIEGTAFRLRFTRHASAGTLGVYVDGTKVADVNANGPVNWQSVYERTGLSNGAHTIEIRHGGGGTFIDIDAIEVYLPAVGIGVYDDRHASWLYGGSWVEAGLAGPYNGTVKYTSDLNATAMIRIEGTAFRLRFTRHSSAGILGVYVDGTKVADVNANGPVNWQSVYERTGLSSGAHTIEIRHGGGGTFIDIDAIEVSPPPVGTGIYDDRHASWLYGGSWVESGLAGPYNGTVKYTSDLSATAMIRIDGTAFRLKFTRHTSAGILGIYVDGTKVADVNANGPLSWQSVYERTGLSSGAHTIEIRHGGGGTFIDIDAIEVFAPSVGTGIYDDRHVSWLYGGSWVEAGLAGPYNGTVKHTSDLKAVALIRINGTAFRLRFTRHTSAGILGVYVDGAKVADVNANGSVNWQSVYERTGLSSGAHTIEVRHGGGGTFIDIDAIEVFVP